MKRRILAAMMACALCFSCILAPCAFASAPSVSSENDAAKTEGIAFGVSDFGRAQVGSNRTIEDVYCGYAYYIAGESGWFQMIATEKDVVVYVPSALASSSGIDIKSEQQCTALQEMLISLDVANAAGGNEVTSGMNWHYTSEKEYKVGNVVFKFDQELKKGQVYATVIGADGTDVTDKANANYTKISHADYGKLKPADQVEIKGQLTGFAWLANFLATLDWSPLWITLKTTLTAIVFIFILGLAAAYFTLRVPDRVKDIADVIFTIPMVLPPTVCGFLLLMLFGSNTAIGRFFIDIGCPLIFSWPATVIAAIIVAFPLMYRNARGAFESIDPNMLDAARTLGWSNPKIFIKIMMPLAWSSIAAGTVLAFARALGEFGATLFLAGNYLGVTRTIPIAIYFEWMNGNMEVTWFWIICILVFSFVVILFINLWSKRTTKYRRKIED